MIDSDGYRPNVGIVIANASGQVLWARRCGQNAWQFPQGGIQKDESPQQALFRELYEELGLGEEDVDILGCTEGWLRYDLPNRYLRKNRRPLCIGQKQVWYLLRLVGEDQQVRFDCCNRPEFDGWKWVSYWRPPHEVIFFKRQVYWQALKELFPLMGLSSRK